jgi:uncharacterized membrane protein
MKSFVSDLSKNEFPLDDRVSAGSVRSSIYKLIKQDYPDFRRENCLSVAELNVYRQKYVGEFLAEEVGEISKLEKTVLHSLKNKKTLVDKIEDNDEKPTPGQLLADGMASFGGSWIFICCFMGFMLFWIVGNVYLLGKSQFDPYPFILLNLILSCLAALQAPVIMMSQKRQEEKDRARGKKDYMINLKSELEIRMLHEKLDHLIMHQQHELIEIQKVQIEMMTDILTKVQMKG